MATHREEELKMARPVTIDPRDDVIHVGCGVRVHKHLICDVSEALKAKVAEYLERMEALPSTPTPGAATKDRDAILPEIADRRALTLWSRFLYGQSIWSSHTDKMDEDFNALVIIHTFAAGYKHCAARDASIDAIRFIVRNHSSKLYDPFSCVFNKGDCKSLPAKVLMDHVVNGNGEFGRRAMNWTDTYLHLIPYMNDDPEHLEHEFCRLYLEKTVRESFGDPPPDLMARCRYHSHRQDELCYLDK